MSNSITGRVLSIGEPVVVQGRNKPFTKREVVIDCTRYDPYTGERSQFENTPALEFGGDIVAELDDIRPGEVVTIHFDVVGTRYVGQDKREKIFTRLRPYKLERRNATQQQQPTQQAPQPMPEPATFPPQQPSLFGEEQLPF
jgi:hypothetical protein